MNVSPSGYYAWLARAPSARAVADAALTERIRAAHTKSHATYGAPRIRAELRAGGERVSGKRITRLMRAAGLQGASRRRGPRTTIRNSRQPPTPDLVERRFVADAPNQLWVADLTYVPAGSGFVYLAVVLDAFSRRIVGWSMRETLHADGVIAALEMAIEQRRPAGVIHHSDRGSQYTSLEFGLRCKAAGVRPSMGSVGDAYDNAMCESFFATLECELLVNKRFATKAEARMAVFCFIEAWYNPHRRHSGLGHLSPIDYERKAAQQHQAEQLAAA